MPVSSTDETLQRVASIFPPPMSGTLLPCLRLDTTISPANTRPNPYREEVVLGDLLPSPASPDPAALAEARAVSDAIDEVLATLDARSRAVIELRFGFAGPPLTLEQVGLRFDVTRERIRQIEKQALKAIAPKLARMLQVGAPARSTRPAPEVPVPAAQHAAQPGPAAPVREPAPFPRTPSVPPMAIRPIFPQRPITPPPRALPSAEPPVTGPVAAPPASAEDRLFESLLQPWQHVPPPPGRRPGAGSGRALPAASPAPAASRPVTAPATPSLPAGLPLDAWLADWRARGFTVVDDRVRGGGVWVRDTGMALAAEIEHLRREGTWFRFAEHRSAGFWGWFLRPAS